jgi:hypothetical protein
MNKHDHHTTLSDWGICELGDGRRFLAGKVLSDPINPDREGHYVTTSLLADQNAGIADGNLVETEDGRYLLVDRCSVDDALFAKLDAWADAQPAPPTLGDVLATGDRELMAGYMLRCFRRATAEAVCARGHSG